MKLYLEITIFILVVFSLQAVAYGEKNNSTSEKKKTIDEEYFEEEQNGKNVNTATLPEVQIKENQGFPKLEHDEAAAGAVLLSEDFDDASDNLPEVLDQQAGVKVTQMGGAASFSSLSIRGSTSDQVLVALDGIVLNSASGGPVDLSKIPLGNIGRIEIYRGVAPLIFGTSSIGGTVSITTKNSRKRELTISGGGGSFASREATLFYSEPQNSWDLSLGIDYRGSKGCFEYTNDNGTLFDKSDDKKVTRKNNEFNQLNLLAKSHIHLGEKWRLTITDWMFWRSQGVAGIGQFETTESDYNLIDNLTSITIDGNELADIMYWHTTLGFRVVHSQFRDPLNEIGLAQNETTDKTYSPSLLSTLTIDLFDWWKLTTQAGYKFELYDPEESKNNPADSSRHTATIGLETNFNIASIDLQIIPSGRLEFISSNLVDNKSVGASQTETNSNKHEWSYRLAIVNESIPDTKLTLSGAKSIRFPSLFELFGNTGKVLGNPELESESAYNIDGGIIYDSTMLPEPNKLRFEVYGFYSHVSNLIQFVQQAQNVFIAENVDKSRIWGIEAGVRADIVKHLRLAGNYTYLNTKNIGEIKARKDKKLPFRPASKWFVKGEGYFEDIEMLQEISFFLEGEWIAGNFLDNANLVSTSERFYLNCGFSIALPNEHARLSFSANNLTDERTVDLAGYPMPGRSFYFVLNWRVI